MQLEAQYDLESEWNYILLPVLASCFTYIEESMSWKAISLFSSAQRPRLPSFYNNSLGKERFIRKRSGIKRHHLEYSVFTFVHVVLLRLGWKWKMSPRNNQKMLQISPHSHAMNSFRRSQSSSSSSGLLISPGLFAYNRHLIYTQSPVSECVQCLLCRQASGWRPAYLSASVHRSWLFSGLWKKKVEPDPVPWWHTLLMCAMLPEICLTGSGQTCIASPHMLCSALGKMRCCNTFLMDWWCLWASLRFEMQPNIGLRAKFQTKETAFVLAFYSNEQWLFCIKKESSSSQVYLWHTSCLAERSMRNNPQTTPVEFFPIA